ncbi:MAG: DUF309 domain-containing protein [Candidatus Methylacidiphilales bacterium]
MSTSSSIRFTSGKSPRIAEHLQGCGESGWAPHYEGFFRCFNAERYYEAHDVLEELWLSQGKDHYDHSYFKGLIQTAGAFVHMKLQRENPDHRVHGARLHPAGRLLRLAQHNVEPYGETHLGLNLTSLRRMLAAYGESLSKGEYRLNPWQPSRGPQLTLIPKSPALDLSSQL